MKWKYVILIIGTIFMLNLVSALDSPFATKVTEITNVTSEVSDFLKADFNPNYGIIRLSNTIFWIPTDKIAEYSLTKNTDYCMIDCSAQGKATLYQDGTLFEDMNFYDIKKDMNQKDLSYKIYIGDGYKNSTREVCSEPKRDEKTGELSKIICENITYLEPIWIDYKFDALKAGDYEWKLEGQKAERDDIEWIPTSFKAKLNQWDTWTSLNWYANTTINASLPDIGGYSTPSVFQKDSIWYLISGEYNGNFYGFVYSDTTHTWSANSTINASLPSIGWYFATTSVFQKDSIWYMISGESTGNFYGFAWNGTQWKTNSTINASLPDIGSNSAPSVFQKDSIWYMISGEDNGNFYGFVYSDTTHTWSANSTINASLPNIVIDATPSVFQKDSIWYMISGNYYGRFYGFAWNGTQWKTNSTINASLPDIGTYSTPSVFQKDSIWYLISGELAGKFFGFNYYEPPDTSSPQYSTIAVNQTNPAILEAVNFTVLWTDNSLSNYTFSWNATGVGCNTWANDSAVSFSGTTNQSTTVKAIPATCLLANVKGIGWKVFTFDSTGNSNVTPATNSFTTPATCWNYVSATKFLSIPAGCLYSGSLTP